MVVYFGSPVLRARFWRQDGDDRGGGRGGTSGEGGGPMQLENVQRTTRITGAANKKGASRQERGREMLCLIRCAVGCARLRCFNSSRSAHRRAVHT